LAIYLPAATKKPLSAAELARQLPIAAQTAWTLRHKIPRAMARGEGELMLRGLVETNESYVGGKSMGPRGLGAMDKTPVAPSAGQRASGGLSLSLAYIQVAESANGLWLSRATLRIIEAGSTISAEGLGAYRRLGGLGYDHDSMILGGSAKAHEFLPQVHLAISNFKRWVLDVFLGVSV